LIRNQGGESGGEIEMVTGLDGEPRHSVFNHLREPAYPADDNGTAAGHRL
jgi:hypothetical protein